MFFLYKKHTTTGFCLLRRADKIKRPFYVIVSLVWRVYSSVRRQTKNSLKFNHCFTLLFEYTIDAVVHYTSTICLICMITKGWRKTVPICPPAWVTRLRENAAMDPAMQSCGNAPRIMQKRQASWTLCNTAAQSSVGTKHTIFNK